MIRIMLAAGSLMMVLTGMEAAAETIPFDSERWDISAQDHRLVEYMGQQSLFLDRGRAYLTDSKFLNGIIEYDIAVTGERSFDAVRWRIQDPGNFEQFYIRPIQSGRGRSGEAIRHWPSQNTQRVANRRPEASSMARITRSTGTDLMAPITSTTTALAPRR